MIYIWHFYDSTLWQYTSTQQDFDNIYPSHGAGVLPIHIHLCPFFCHCRHAFRVRWWTFWVGVPETLAVTLRSWTEPLSLFKQNHHVSYDLSFDMDVPCPAQAGPGSYLQVSSSLTANVPSAKPRLGFMMILKWPRGPSCHVFLVRKRFCFNFLLMTGWPSGQPVGIVGKMDQFDCTNPWFLPQKEWIPHEIRLDLWPHLLEIDLWFPLLNHA